MLATYRAWLESQQYVPATVSAQLHRVGRVEDHHGNLDEHFDRDRMESLIATFVYSAADGRNRLPNPTQIPIDGKLRENLASYRDAVKRYRDFRLTMLGTAELAAAAVIAPNVVAAVEEARGGRIGLERDLQAALRLEIAQLEKGMTIIDEGSERSVDAGFIDITARDIAGMAVVIELKAGKAGRDAVGQILSYMGDIADDEPSGTVRGILIAADFDSKAKAAARMVPNLELRRYSVRFTFADGHA